MQRYVGGKKSARNDWHRIIYAQVLAFICLLLCFQALEVSDYIVHHAKHTVACSAFAVLVNQQSAHLRHCIRNNDGLLFQINVAPP